MKIDMHCHVKEGSVDSKVGLEEYIAKLKQCGFDGMVITDHDTYRGYRYWKSHIKDNEYKDFVVLKGMEYDTRDGGHILVIMPQGVRMRLLELRGLPVSVLIDFVHHHGGVLGPAHPCGAKYLSLTTTKRYARTPEIMKRFDFVEIFNSCESEESNRKAEQLARKYGKLGIGGSDAHKIECVGRGYTELPEYVACETELIALLRKGENITIGGRLYTKTTKERIGRAHKLLSYCFWVYNKGGELLKRSRRKEKLSVEQPIDPIDPIDLQYLDMIRDVSHKKSK